MYVFLLPFIGEESHIQNVKCSMLHTFFVAKPELKPEFSESDACALYTMPHCLFSYSVFMFEDSVSDRDTRGPYKPVCNQDVKAS